MESRQQEISEISRSIKGLARELQVPVIALSQLNRRPEDKGREGRPQLSDLRESGALEQDADVVAAIFREEVYKRDDPDVKGKAKLFVLKQRNGPIGDIDLNFISEFTKFVDPAPKARTSEVNKGSVGPRLIRPTWAEIDVRRLSAQFDGGGESPSPSG
jgi:replicative DNA helicase